jgi:hypothetical protein
MATSGERDIALWFRGFIAAHQERFPHGAWPEDAQARKEFFAPWKAALAKAGATADQAERASVALAEDPPRYLSDHLPALLKILGGIRREEGAAGGRFEDRAEAEAASRGCVHCGGGGLASTPHPADGRMVAATCVCPAGRWMRDRIDRGKDRQLAARFPDLASDRARLAAEAAQADLDDRVAEHWAALGDLERAEWRMETFDRLPRLAEAVASRGCGAWPRAYAESLAARACYLGQRVYEADPWAGMRDLAARPGAAAAIGRRQGPAPAVEPSAADLEEAERRREELRRQIESRRATA